MKCIVLGSGHVATMDDDDYERFSHLPWFAMVSEKRKDGTSRIYVKCRPGPRAKRSTIYLHRIILGAGKGFDVDHINGDGLDNRRENLRICTRSQNMRNRTCKKHGATSRFKGVIWYEPTKKWRAEIRADGFKRHIGYFADEEAAAMAYDDLAERAFGEFARKNFPT